jgi:hypothetical protein
LALAEIIPGFLRVKNGKEKQTQPVGFQMNQWKYFHLTPEFRRRPFGRK